MNHKLLTYLTFFNHWRKQKISQNNFLILAAAITGTLGGIAASLLKRLTHIIENFLQNDLHWEYKYYLYFFFPLIGIFLTVFYIKAFIRRRKFQYGISSIIENISSQSSKIDFHNIYSQIFSSALTVGFGGSAGLEAPIVASGSSIGSNIGRLFGLSYRETTLLLACGAAAGIAGAFNSPVAGMVFALEVLMPGFSIPAFIPLLIASALSSVVSRIIYDKPLFVLVTGDWVTKAVGFYILFAIVSGLFSVYYNRVNANISDRFKKIESRYKKVWIGGIGLGILIAFFPALYGEGYITIQNLLNGNYSSLLAYSFFSGYQQYPWLLLAFAILTLFGKTIASSLTMSSGGNGGMFGPTVVVGGLLGFVFAFGINLTGLAQLNITNFMIAGMAAAVSGMMHAPLTGLFLSAEITGGYELFVPLMIVSAISYFINKHFLKHSIYTKKIAESSNLSTHQSKEQNLLNRMKLKYLIERDFVVLHPEETPMERSKDIIHTNRNVFPVVSDEGALIGILHSDLLLEALMDTEGDKKNMLIGTLSQPPEKSVDINTPMSEVLRQMDSLDIRILPVTGSENRYLGFVSKNGIFNKYRRLLRRQRDYLQ
jgi:CIC family chloride channel protein